MTAAVIDRSPAPAATCPPTGRRPRLVPVPDSEPPRDDELGAKSTAPATAPATAPGGPATAPAGATATAPVETTATAPAGTGPGGTGVAARHRPVRQRLPGPVAVAPAVRPIRRGLPARPAGTPSATPAGNPGRWPAPARRRPPRPHGTPPRARVVSAHSVPGWSNETDVGVRMTSTAALPSAKATGTAMARALLEVLSGCRPAAQLRTHCAPDVFAGLQRTPRLGQPGTVKLLSTQLCEPADGVVEMSAVFRCSERVRAMALRLQGVDGRWRLTALHLG